MAKYLYRSCPRCNGYVGIVMRQPERDMPLQAVNGRCVRCRYRFAWIVIRGGRVRSVSRQYGSIARKAPKRDLRGVS
jgi:hypothetical protein